MKLFKNYVEVKQVMTKKDSKVLMLDSTPANDDTHEITQEIIQVGPFCKFVEIGDVPIVAPHFQEYGRKLVSSSKDENEIVFHVIYSEDDFIGIE